MISAPSHARRRSAERLEAYAAQRGRGFDLAKQWIGYIDGRSHDVFEYLQFLCVSNSERGSSDWRITLSSVPRRSSLWRGTGTVIVRPTARFCIMRWLPR